MATPIEEQEGPVCWPPPVDLVAVPNPRSIPTDAFPDWVRAEVEALAEALQVPAELPALLVLATSGLALGGRVFVSSRDGWNEPCNLYTVTALEPGSAKSPVFKALMKPVTTVENELQEAAAERVARLGAERAALAKSIKKHKDLAANTDDPDERAREIDVASFETQELAKLPLAVAPRLTTGNATAEALQRLLSVHDGKFGVFHDEGGVFDILNGRYGNNPDLDPWLNGHDGGALGSDRMGKDGLGDNTKVPAAYVTMGLAVQHEVLHELGKSSRISGRGVTARFLFGVPNSLVGKRNLVDATPVPAEVKQTYTRKMEALLRTLINETDAITGPVTLTLDDNAAAIFADFQTRNERALDSRGPLRWIKGWGAKLPGQTLRIAGNLHLLEHFDSGWDKPISGDTMRSAVRIAIALIDHARLAHDMLGLADDLADARLVLKWLTDRNISRVTKRETYREIRRLDSERAGDALARLVEYGWIIEEDPDPDHIGRRSEAYLVHPSVWDTGTDNTDDLFGDLA